jgi:hypothetical protein
MTSRAREYNQKNLVVIKNLEYQFISDEINKGSFGTDIKNSSYTSNSAVSIFKNDENIVLVSHYESKDGGGLKNVSKADKDIYERYLKIKEENKIKQEEQKNKPRFRRK